MKERHLLRRDGFREENYWPLTAAIDGRLCAIYDGARHRCSIIGGLASDRTWWKSTMNQHLKRGEEKLLNAAEEKRIRRKEHSNSSRPETTHRCDLCDRVASAESVSSATGDVAPAEQTVRTARTLHPWPAMAEGAYYYIPCHI